MNPAEIFDALNAKQCEQIAERFVHAMHGHEAGLHGGQVTAALLVEVWQDVQASIAPKKPVLRAVK